MADNYTTNAGSGGDTFAADDVGGIKTPRVKLQWGPDGTVNDADVASGKPIPVQLRASTGTELALATAAKQPALGTAGSASSDVITIQGIASGTVVPVADGGGSLTVDGTVPITANSAVNVAQINGVTTSMGNGVSGTGVIRVTLASDSTGQVALAAGTNGIGKLTANSGVVIGAVEQSGTWNVGTVTTVTTVSTVTSVTAIANALPAGTNLLGRVSSSDETSTVYNATTALTPKFAKITASSSGATTIVAAVTSKKIRVLKWDLVCNGAVNVKWQSHVTPTDITGLSYFAANGGLSSGYCPLGHFETVSGEALDINLSGAVAVGGSLVYVEV